jgi:hypothetical protein
VAGTVLSAALFVPLAYPGYMLGSWRWLKRNRNTWEMGMILLPFFFAWYFVLRLDGGSQVLVPIAMVWLVAGFALGRRAYHEQLRKRRGGQ